MAWEQFTTSDTPILAKFISGLARSRAHFIGKPFDVFTYALDRKPQCEGWVFDGTGHEIGMIMCFKPTINRHALLWSYARGSITQAEIFLAMMEKMDDYVAGHGGSGYNATMIKDGTNEYAGFSIANANAALGAFKTLTVVSENVLGVSVEIDPI